MLLKLCHELHSSRLECAVTLLCEDPSLKDVINLSCISLSVKFKQLECALEMFVLVFYTYKRTFQPAGNVGTIGFVLCGQSKRSLVSRLLPGFDFGAWPFRGASSCQILCCSN